MLHMKMKYGENLLGVLVYVKANSGISPDRAKSICYSFDRFFDVPTSSRNDPTKWDPLVDAIISFINQ